MLLLLAIVIGLRLLYGLKPHKQKNTKKTETQSKQVWFPVSRGICVRSSIMFSVVCDHVRCAAVDSCWSWWQAAWACLRSIHCCCWLVSGERWQPAGSRWFPVVVEPASIGRYVWRKLIAAWSRVCTVLPPSERRYSVVDGSVIYIDRSPMLAYLSFSCMVDDFRVIPW